MAYGHLKDHIEKLSLFVEVARARSFHRAARHLGLSQPTLSQAVKTLEDTLEAKLFVRSQRGVELTAAGLKLLSFSERLLSEVEGVESRIRFPDQTMAGTVTLGVFSSLATYVLPRFLVHLAKTFPELKIRLVTMRAEELAGGLTSRRCHLVVGSGKLEQKTISQFELYGDHFGFFIGKKLKERTKKTPLIYVARAKDDKGNTLDRILNELEEDGHRFELDSFETVQAMTLEGLGVGVLPRRLAERNVNAGHLSAISLSKLGKKFGHHRFYCSILNEDQDDPLLTTLKNQLREWCQHWD
jgi:DNA-binding transcriptional LysR family regulator